MCVWVTSKVQCEWGRQFLLLRWWVGVGVCVCVCVSLSLSLYLSFFPLCVCVCVCVCVCYETLLLFYHVTNTITLPTSFPLHCHILAFFDCLL